MILAFVGLALAQDPTPETAPETPPPENPGEPGSVEVGGTLKQVRERVIFQPYWDPIGSAALYGGVGNQTLAFNLGLEAGVAYADTETILAGKTRARAQGIFVGGLAGSDLRVGSFIGPQKDLWSVMGGVDVFRNGFNGTRTQLPMSWGVEFPVVATFGPPEVAFLFGASTAWLAEPSRRVDWSTIDTFGFGHEFAWQAGVAVYINGFHVAGAYSRRQTTRGPVQGFGFSIGF
ncbi:MAG: hypothetical protein VX899_21625 [Myxococcota bacterium]|nr:hypothetical protein [Myxococcota bacterium]